MTDLRKPARWPELNERYRAEGWGQVAEAALGTYPENVEAQAREVARYAHAEISRGRSDYERVLALLAEAREALVGRDGGVHDTDCHSQRIWQGYPPKACNCGHAEVVATLPRIDDALAAEREARG